MPNTLAVSVAHAVTFIVPWMPEAAAQEIKGVSLSDLPKYKTSAFRCLDDHGASQQLLPLSAINDEFCDCSDGSDEPGTSACAGQKQTLFYCKNEGSDAVLIYTSRVNDGICDCCDGSDEWRAAQGVCPNTCEDEGRKLAEERHHREAEVKSGIEQRKKLEETAKVELLKHGQELSSRKEELGRLERELLQAKATLESVTAAHQAASQVTETTTEETPANSQSSGTHPSTGNAQTALQTDQGSIEGNHAEGDATKTLATNADPTPEEQVSKSDDAVISEYTKWMDGAETTSSGQEVHAGGSPEETEADGDNYRFDGSHTDDDDDDDDSPDELPAKSSTSEERQREEANGFLARQWSKIRNGAVWVCSKVWTGCKPHASSDKEVAEQAYSDLQRRVRASRGEVANLEKRIETYEREDLLAFATLDKRCVSMKDNQYKWELCFFEKAKQDSTSLGKWKEWERPGVALFANGETCWGGPERSIRVLFHCGPKEELYDVSEPSRCSYEARMRHPAACTQEVLQSLWPKGPRMPHEEL